MVREFRRGASEGSVGLCAARVRPAARVLLLLLAAGCAAPLELPAGPGARRDDEASGSCFERPASAIYMHQLQDHVMDHWVVPSDLQTDHWVMVRLWLSEDGALLGHRQLTATSARLAASVDLAISHSAPFRPLPEGARCLARRALDMRFENPH